LAGARPAPPFKVLKPVTQRHRWLVYFIFAPAGKLEPYHHFSLRKLRQHDAGLLVIFAGKVPGEIPAAIADVADACYWKGLNGYDFSAYSIALNAIATHSPGADVLVMNDSVFGPLVDLTPFLDDAPWNLTGFTATNVSGQKHIQSYAFILKDVTADRLHALRWIFPERFAFNSAVGAVSCQELWFARVASRSMLVGSYWYGEDAVSHDPSLTRAVALVEAGFPFLKRSLLGKHKKFQPAGEVEQLLKRLDCNAAP